MRRRPTGTRVYEDVPLEMFADRLPAWPGPTGDTMSYSIDRSARSRGVGAVASRDLRDGGGGALVRTARGGVMLQKSSEKRRSRWDPLGGTGFNAPIRPIPPGSTIPRRSENVKVKTRGSENVKVRTRTGLVRPAFTDTAPPNRPLRKVVVSSTTPVILTAGGPTRASENVKVTPSGMSSGATGGQAAPYNRPVVVSPGYGGSSAGTASGGGIPLEEEVTTVMEEPSSPAPKPGMSTGVKIAAGLGLGWVLLSMFRGE